MSSRFRMSLGRVFVVLVFAVRMVSAEGDLEAEWLRLQGAKKELAQMEPPSLEGEAFQNFLKEYSRRAGELADGFKAFYEREPESREGKEAWRHWLNYLDNAAHGSAARKAELDEAEKRYLADPNLSIARRDAIRNNQVERIGDLKERERFVRSVTNEFPNPASFASYHLLNIAEFADAEQAQRLVDEVLELAKALQNGEHLREEALALKEKLSRIGQAVELRFTALDGRQIDLAHYKGKVVLIDFWATWCPPCVTGIPKVREAWEKYRGEGFDVICVSYDTEREKIEKFVKKNSLPWPQFFSEEGKKAPLVTKLRTPGPPAYWLIDRDGNVADLTAMSDLAAKIERLLARQAANGRRKVE